jgi:hypothetical protein
MPDPGERPAAALIALARTATAGLWTTRRRLLPGRLPSRKGPRHRRVGVRRAFRRVRVPTLPTPPALCRGSAAQALFSAGLLVEVDPLPSDDVLAVVSAGFLALSAPRSPSDLAGLPRESVR